VPRVTSSGIGALLLRPDPAPVVRLRVDGRLVYEEGPNLTAANGETFGSGCPSRQASVRDRVLDHVVVGDVGFWGAMLILS
jgi:diacylglycerol kinase family enzyme